MEQNRKKDQKNENLDIAMHQIGTQIMNIHPEDHYAITAKERSLRESLLIRTSKTTEN